MRLALLLLTLCQFLPAAEWQLVSVSKIWDRAPHSAFGDLTHWNGRWYAVFREGQGHAPSPGKPDDGRLRVISSPDGASWKSDALVEETGVDLRDPHLSITPDNRLMIVAGGSFYPNGEYKTRQSRVLFSHDGKAWTKPVPVVADGHWLWRVIWHRGTAYGVSKYGSPMTEKKENPRKIRLVKSTDGIHWDTVTELAVPGGDETTVRIHPDGRMIALTRRTWDDGNIAWIGVSKPPYKDWTWSPSGHFIGGPNFTILPNGVWAAGGRLLEKNDPKQRYTELGELTLSGFTTKLRLPSGGDSSYPGFVWHNNQLWTLYYSSHEGKTCIYLAKIRLK
ncbi:MAG TPA: sialidase family protein [Bryobacteraceae bacterium]|nr:sialidase family protein [Bryobacteraceae bacterium]